MAPPLRNPIRPTPIQRYLPTSNNSPHSSNNILSIPPGQKQHLRNSNLRPDIVRFGDTDIRLKFDDASRFGIGGVPVLVELGGVDGACLEVVGREGFEIGSGGCGGDWEAFFDYVPFESVQPDPADFGHGVESFGCL